MSWRRACRYIAMPRRRFARCLSTLVNGVWQLLTAGAHKIGGPRGIGILYVQRGLPMHTTAFGGNQERGLRSGTEPVFLAVGMAEAVRITAAHMETDMEYAASLRERAIEGLKREIPDAVVHAPEGGSPTF